MVANVRYLVSDHGDRCSNTLNMYFLCKNLIYVSACHSKIIGGLLWIWETDMERGGDEDSKREVGDMENDMFKRKMGIDRHSPRLIPNITRL
jgi:hypothetical protein